MVEVETIAFELIDRKAMTEWESWSRKEIFGLEILISHDYEKE